MNFKLTSKLERVDYRSMQNDISKNPHKRQPFLAFLMSFILMGLGQVYNGQLKKGIFLLLLIFPVYLLLGLTGLFSHFYGLVAIIILLVCYRLLVGIEAFMTSRKLNPYELKPVNKIWIYILFAIFAYGVMYGAAMINRQLIGYESFEIPTMSMEPSILSGDLIMGTTINGDEVELGDIISFTREDGMKYLGRVVGLPNQQITIQDDRVIYADGEEQWVETRTYEDGSYFEYQDYECTLPNGRKFKVRKSVKYMGQPVPAYEYSDIETQTLSSNELFVMGDNRNNSMDSRMYGAIPLDRIDTRINYVWWSDWMERIGEKLD